MRIRALAAVALLGGCAVTVPPHLVDGPAHGAPVPARIAMQLAPVAGEAPPPLAVSFAQALAAALARHGVQVAADAPYRLDLALALRGDNAGITPDKSGTLRTLKWSSAPRRPHLFDKCRAQRLRVTVIGTPADAAPGWHGTGELAGCTVEPAALAALAEQFAVAMTR